MNANKVVAPELDDLPIDIFELGNQGFTVESLTAGHGMTEVAGSCCCSQSPCTCDCSCCPCLAKEEEPEVSA